MNQKLKYGFVFLFLGVIAAVLFWPETTDYEESGEERASARLSQNRSPLTQEKEGVIPPVDPKGDNVREVKEQREVRMKNELMKALNSPVEFWGKVVDEEGNPVSGARAEISITNKFSWNPTADSTRTKYVKMSDSSGLFSLLGKKGGSLYVNVYAEGYVPSKDKKTERDLSRASLSYSGKNDSMHFQRPTEGDPMVFVLRKKNPVANLAHDFKKRVSVGKNGETQKIELKTERKAIGLEVRCWSSCPVPFTYDRYDWRAEIEIAGGKLQAITELEPVTAPTEGYQQVFQVEMPKDTQENWLRSSPNGQRDFWVLFDDGTYAKARIEVRTGRTHEVDVEVWYNVDGTNNFEQ